MITALLGSDEIKSLKRGFTPTLKKSKSETASINSNKILRVVSINCNGRKVEAVLEALDYNPDVVFLQESPSSADLQKINNK